MCLLIVILVWMYSYGVLRCCVWLFIGESQAMRNWDLADEWIVIPALRRYWRVACLTQRGRVVPRGLSGDDRDTCALVVPTPLHQNIQHSLVLQLTLSSSVNLKNNCKISTPWPLVITETTDKEWTQDEAA